MNTTPRRLLNSCVIALLAASATVLTGCAALKSVSSEVSSYGTWPTGRAPGTYAFERLPSQQVDGPLQSQIEAAAAPALDKAGFKPAASADVADVVVQVAAQSRLVPSPWAGRWDPFWPYGRVGVGGWYGRGGRVGVGMGMGMSLEPPLSDMQVDVLIRDKRGNQVLYETHALRRQNVGWDERLMPPMFEAALKDFPLPAISPRVVTIPLPPKAAASRPN